MSPHNNRQRNQQQADERSNEAPTDGRGDTDDGQQRQREQRKTGRQGRLRRREGGVPGGHGRRMLAMHMDELTPGPPLE